MRPAAEILLLEAAALPDVLSGVAPSAFDRPTVCAGWSVRDVLAHCGAALTHAAAGTLHGFTPADNQRDVDMRATWPIAVVLDELLAGYAAAAVAIDAAGGALDGIGLGEWVHGGDVRDGLGVDGAYTSAGVDLAIGLLLERSRLRRKPPLQVTIGDTLAVFGIAEPPRGNVVTDTETFVRLCGGRRPDPARYQLTGCTRADLVLFS